MIISLPTGKCIEVSLETYLRMTDEDFEYLVATNWGTAIENPFQGSVLTHGEINSSVLSEEDLEEMGINDVTEISDIPDESDPYDEIDYTPDYT